MTKVEYVACIICGKTVVKAKLKNEGFRIEPLDFRILQVREQKGGRSEQGFFDIPEEGKTILQLWNGSDEEKAIVEIFKSRLLSIVRSYLKAGIIQRNEIVPTES